MITDYNEPPSDVYEFQKIASSIPSWKKNKSYGQIQTYTEWIKDNFWGARGSIHKKPSFESFKSVLFDNHTRNEAQYMHIISNCRELDAPDPWQSYELEYSLPFPFGKRTFVIWILVKDVSDDEFFVLSLPRTSDNPNSRGRYISVETVKHTSEGVEWTMATTADAGGIPHFIQRWTLPGTLAKDVPAVLGFIKEKQRKKSKQPPKKQKL